MLLLRNNSIDRLYHTLQTDDVANGPLGALERAKLLPDDDRLFLELVLSHRMTVRQVGLALKRSPGNVTRRIQKLINRLNDPLTIALADPTCTLDAQMRRIGLEYFLHRAPIKRIARNHELTPHEVRKSLEYIRGWTRGLSIAARR